MLQSRAVKTIWIFITYFAGSESQTSRPFLPTTTERPRVLQCYYKKEITVLKNGYVIDQFDKYRNKLHNCSGGSICGVTISLQTWNMVGKVRKYHGRCYSRDECLEGLCKVRYLGRYHKCAGHCCDTDLCNVEFKPTAYSETVTITDSTPELATSPVTTDGVPLFPRIQIPIATKPVSTTTMNDQREVGLIRNPVFMYTTISSAAVILLFAGGTILCCRRKRLKRKNHKNNAPSSTETLTVIPYAETAKSTFERNHFNGATELMHQHEDQRAVSSVTTFSTADRTNTKTSRHCNDETKHSYHQIGGAYETPLPSQQDTGYLPLDTLPSSQTHTTSSFINRDHVGAKSRRSGHDENIGKSQSDSTCAGDDYLTPIKRSLTTITEKQPTSCAVDHGYLTPFERSRTTIRASQSTASAAEKSDLIPVKKSSANIRESQLTSSMDHGYLTPIKKSLTAIKESQSELTAMEQGYLIPIKQLPAVIKASASNVGDGYLIPVEKSPANIKDRQSVECTTTEQGYLIPIKQLPAQITASASNAEDGYLIPIKKSSANMGENQPMSSDLKEGYLMPMKKPPAEITEGGSLSTNVEEDYLIPINKSSVDIGEGESEQGYLVPMKTPPAVITEGQSSSAGGDEGNRISLKRSSIESQSASTATEQGYLIPMRRMPKEITEIRSPSSTVEEGYLIPFKNPSESIVERQSVSTTATRGYLTAIDHQRIVRVDRDT